VRQPLLLYLQLLNPSRGSPPLTAARLGLSGGPVQEPERRGDRPAKGAAAPTAPITHAGRLLWHRERLHVAATTGVLNMPAPACAAGKTGHVSGDGGVCPHVPMIAKR
jgi:hypothetical protein